MIKAYCNVCKILLFEKEDSNKSKTMITGLCPYCNLILNELLRVYSKDNRGVVSEVISKIYIEYVNRIETILSNEIESGSFQVKQLKLK